MAQKLLLLEVLVYLLYNQGNTQWSGKEIYDFNAVGSNIAPGESKFLIRPFIQFFYFEQLKPASSANECDDCEGVDSYEFIQEDSVGSNIKKYNLGMSFILAGYSQGTIFYRLILSKYKAENPDMYMRMIAVYVTGYPSVNKCFT